MARLYNKTLEFEKSKKDYLKPLTPVPLNQQTLTVIHEQKGLNSFYVFTYKGNLVKGCNNHAWSKALKRAGIDNFRWHDLRYAWAS
ncbi:MAG: hypothetical protein PSN04_04080 [Methyloprofundus sp.]|nr:hypothetical protein [Methyloprofundus sp.]